MNENFDIMYSPPAPVGRPSKAYLAQKAEKQRRRIALLNILRPNDATEAQSIATTNTIPPSTQVQPITTTNTIPPSTQLQPTNTTPPTTQAQPTIITPPATDPRPRHRNRNYTIAFKLHVANYADSHSIRATAAHFGLDRRTIRLWIQNRHDHNQSVGRQTRYRVSRDNVGRFAEMEAELYDYIIDQRDQGFCAASRSIMDDTIESIVFQKME